MPGLMFTQSKMLKTHIDMGGATGGCGGQCPPLLGPAGYRAYGGGRFNENNICIYSRQSLFSTVQV